MKSAVGLFVIAEMAVAFVFIESGVLHGASRLRIYDRSRRNGRGRSGHSRKGSWAVAAAKQSKEPQQRSGKNEPST